jgi:hypothetical protein
MVVDTFRDLEEPGVAFHDDPSGIDVRTAGVRKQCLQEFSDATTGRGRVHVHHPPAREARPRRLGGRRESLGTIRTEQSCEPFERDRLHLHFVQISEHATATSVVNCLIGVRAIDSWSPARCAPVDAFAMQVRVRRDVAHLARLRLDLGNAVQVPQWDADLCSAHGLDDQHTEPPLLIGQRGHDRVPRSARP